MPPRGLFFSVWADFLRSNFWEPGTRAFHGDAMGEQMIPYFFFPTGNFKKKGIQRETAQTADLGSAIASRLVPLHKGRLS